jgi:CRISPR/Cas system-associated exonuclease Cas4 (RecB family)
MKIIIHATKEARERYKDMEVPVKEHKTSCPSCSLIDMTKETNLNKENDDENSWK